LNQAEDIHDSLHIIGHFCQPVAKLLGLLTVDHRVNHGAMCNAWSGGNFMSEQSERSNPDECEEQNAPPIEYADT